MANALQAVLQLRSDEAAREKQASAELTAGLEMLNTARQQATANQFAQLQMKASLAEKGLIIDPSSPSGFKKDDSLQDPLTKLLTAGKVAEAAKNLNLPDVFQKAQQSVQSLSGTPVGNAIQPSAQADANEIINQKDAFGEYTPQAKAAQKANEQIQSEIVKGPAEGAVGKIALANESLKNIEDIKTALFPDGTPKSFNREIAFGSNPPALNLPIIGRVGARVRRDNPLDPTDDKVVEKTQDVFRKIGASLSGRQLIQTGVAARPEETQKLLEQFGPNMFSNPEAALKGLNELQTFYKDYLHNALPEKRLNKESSAKEEVKVKELDVNTARQILQQAGGDKVKARELAKQQGYKF